MYLAQWQDIAATRQVLTTGYSSYSTGFNKAVQPMGAPQHIPVLHAAMQVEEPVTYPIQEKT